MADKFQPIFKFQAEFIAYFARVILKVIIHLITIFFKKTILVIYILILAFYILIPKVFISF